MLLLTFTASAKAAQHTKTTKPKIIIIFLPFLNKSLLSLINLCYPFVIIFLCSSSTNWPVRTIFYYLEKLIFLFTTTASTSAAQQIANINPNTIIIMFLSLFVILITLTDAKIIPFVYAHKYYGSYFGFVLYLLIEVNSLS